MKILVHSWLRDSFHKLKRDSGFLKGEVKWFFGRAAVCTMTAKPSAVLKP